MGGEAGMMRAFVAIELPEDVKERLVALSSHLRASKVRASWVKPERFLGRRTRTPTGWI